MKSCESYEMHISALMDGETSRADTLAILDHLPACTSCQEFYRDCRELQRVADRLPLSSATDLERAGAENDLEPADAGRRIVTFPRQSRWVWAAAASVALFVGAASVWLRPSIPTALGAGPHVIDLSVQKPNEPMDDAHFMEISVALLHAEPRYQRTMIEILERFERSRGLDESSVDVAATESGEPWTRSEFDNTDGRGASSTQPQP